MQKLATQDKVIASIAPIASSSVMAAAQVNESAKILGISLTASNPNVTVDPETEKFVIICLEQHLLTRSKGAVMANFAKYFKSAKGSSLH